MKVSIKNLKDVGFELIRKDIPDIYQKQVNKCTVEVEVVRNNGDIAYINSHIDDAYHETRAWKKYIVSIETLENFIELNTY